MGFEMETVRIDSERQLFLDDHVIDRMVGAHRRIREPVLREVSFYFDLPWEGSVSWCPVVIKDDGRYRMWYRSEAADHETGKMGHSFTGYSESEDGVHWERPSLGIVEFQGSSENNLCIHDPDLKNVAVFRDDGPQVSEEGRYKAVGRWTRGSPSQIYGMISEEGIHWRKVQEGPLIVAEETDPQFDSPLSAFWDERADQYVIYVRGWLPDGPGRRIRAIRRSTSDDFHQWSPWEYIRIEGCDSWPFHLYTNAGHPYYRAPIYLMFPKRFIPDRKFLDEWWHEGQSDVIMLSSRDGLSFQRPTMNAFLRPGLDRKNWHERSIFIGPRVVPTGEGEMSMYSVQNYRTDTAHIRRLSMREDGFVSIASDADGGSLITKPVTFDGSRLEINYSTSAAGIIRIGLMDENECDIAGYTSDDCEELFGDEIAHTVRWGNDVDLRAMRARPVRLKFELAEADLFSFCFS